MPQSKSITGRDVKLLCRLMSGAARATGVLTNQSKIQNRHSTGLGHLQEKSMRILRMAIFLVGVTRVSLKHHPCKRA